MLLVHTQRSGHSIKNCVNVAAINSNAHCPMEIISTKRRKKAVLSSSACLSVSLSLSLSLFLSFVLFSIQVHFHHRAFHAQALKTATTTVHAFPDIVEAMKFVSISTADHWTSGHLVRVYGLQLHWSLSAISGLCPFAILLARCWWRPAKKITCGLDQYWDSCQEKKSGQLPPSYGTGSLLRKSLSLSLSYCLRETFFCRRHRSSYQAEKLRAVDTCNLNAQVFLCFLEDEVQSRSWNAKLHFA